VSGVMGYRARSDYANSDSKGAGMIKTYAAGGGSGKPVRRSNQVVLTMSTNEGGVNREVKGGET
jgi:hypothetical protein